MKQLDKIKKILKAAGHIEPGSVLHVTVEHDDDCPALKTQRLSDCVCNPDIQEMKRQ
jgi:hypothetical protein